VFFSQGPLFFCPALSPLPLRPLVFFFISFLASTKKIFGTLPGCFVPHDASGPLILGVLTYNKFSFFLESKTAPFFRPSVTVSPQLLRRLNKVSPVYVVLSF